VALNEFEGTVLLVSHDRALLRAVCDEFWLVSRGGVSPFDGDLDDYQAYLLDEAKRQREAVQAAAKAEAAAAVAARKTDAQRRQEQQDRQDRQRPLKKELSQVEAGMAKAQAEIAQINERLVQPLPPTELAEAGRRLKVLEAELASHEERWLELTEALDALQR
jgi:ATP-binding cassette subfamily F protein 3